MAEITTEITNVTTTDGLELTAAKRDKAALGWFALGVIVGAVLAIVVLTLRGVGSQAPDIAAIREAARQGALEAIGGNTASAKTAASWPTASEAVPATDVEVPLGNNILGDKNAPVTMIEYSDFQCPFCGKFHREAFPQVLAQYIKTGKMKFVYKHFAFLGKESSDAARASECAADQGKFWEYHDKLFASQNGENQGAFSTENLLKLGAELILDKVRFQSCLTNDETAQRVLADTAEGRRLGVRGTPQFLINGRVVVGAQPYEAFKQVIDDALKSAP